MLDIARVRSALAGLVLVLLASRPSSGAEDTVIEGAIVTLIEQADVPARAAGPLAELLVREGDVVKRGDVLAKIDDAEAKLAAARAEVELTVARREAKNELPVLAAEKAAAAARAELKRAMESSAKFEKSVSQSELDRLQLSADEADLKQRQAVHVRETAELAARIKENELQTIRHRLQLHEIVAPIDGVVVEMRRRPGEWVEPGAAVVRLVLMQRLRVEAFCDVSRLESLAVGRPVRVRVVAAGAEPASYEGRITFVSPEVNPVNGQVRIWAEVENRDGVLHPGMNGTLTLADGGASAKKDARGRAK
jgi:macrolide-specific efflux system membrane fusion protein